MLYVYALKIDYNMSYCYMFAHTTTKYYVKYVKLVAIFLFHFTLVRLNVHICRHSFYMQLRCI